MDYTKAQAAGINEAIASDVVKRQIYGERYSAGLASKVIRNLVALEADLRAQIAKADVNGVKTMTGRRKRLQALLEETRREIRKTYRAMNRVSTAELSELMTIEAKATQALINRAAGSLVVEIGAGLPTPAVLAALTDQLVVAGLPLLSWWEKQSIATIDNVQRELTIGMQAGESIEEMTRRIVGTSVTSPDGVIPLAKRTARTLVRTSVSSVQNTARQSTYEANADIFVALIHLSRLDSRTSKICIARSGKRWEVISKAPIDHKLPFQVPPLHPSCLIGHVKVIPIGELNGGSQRHVTGLVYTIVTASGRIIECTPNHPILTYDGWKPARLVDVHDRLLCLAERGGTEIKALALSVIKSSNAEFYSLRTDDRHYHGDGSMSRSVDLALYEHVNLSPQVKLQWGTFDDAKEFQRQLIMDTGVVDLDQVASVDHTPFDGMVYNLETASGLYTASGIITHNCRSVLIPQVIGGTPPPDMDADVWLKSLGKAEVERLLGVKGAKLYLAGKIKASELIDQSNRPLSLEQLAKL